MNTEALKEVIKSRGYTNMDIIDALKIDDSTFYRKMISGEFSVKQASVIVEKLNLDTNTANKIFLE